MNDIETLGKIIELLSPLRNAEKIRILEWLENLRDSEWYDEDLAKYGEPDAVKKAKAEKV